MQHRPGFEAEWTPAPADFLRRALSHLDPRLYRSRPEWLRMAMACHHATGGQGHEAFLDWSAKDPLYGNACRAANSVQWRSLDGRQVANPVTVGTLVKELRAVETDAADQAADDILFHDEPIPVPGEPPPELVA